MYSTYEELLAILLSLIQQANYAALPVATPPSFRKHPCQVFFILCMHTAALSFFPIVKIKPCRQLEAGMSLALYRNN